MACAAENKVLSLRFNQDQGCFVCCTESGLRVYNIEPLVEKAYYDIEVMGSVSTAEMYWRTNLIAVVGGGRRPKFADNAVLLFDDLKKKFYVDIHFSHPVKAVRLCRNRMVVAVEREVHVFSFPKPMERLLTMETRDNPKGLLELSPLVTNEKQILAFPGASIGSLQLLDLAATNIHVTSTPATIHAHISELACIAINMNGTKVATASETGTLIRIWDSSLKTKLFELRRGSDRANIYSINFSQDSDFLCVSSDKGTVHIFAIKDVHLNKKYQISSIASYFCTYMDSMYSFASFTIPPESACICAFNEKNSVVAVCMDGTFHKYNFSTDGQCIRNTFESYLTEN